MPAPDPRQVAVRATQRATRASGQQRRYFTLPKSSDLCPLGTDAAATLGVTTAAIDAYRATHSGTQPDQVAEALRSMAGDLIAMGRWEHRTGTRLHLAAYGYQVVISADLADIVSYRTSQPHRTWAQNRARLSATSRTKHRRYLKRRHAKRQRALVRAGLTVKSRTSGGRSTTVTTPDHRTVQVHGRTLRNLSVAQWEDLVRLLATELDVTVCL
jgi:hypothetical protein